MTLGPDILLDDDGDLDLSNGDLQMVVSVAQNIRVRLLYVQSEWFLDTSKGLPYFEVIFVKNPNITHLGAIFRRCIRETPGVASLDSFSLDFNVNTRELVINFAASTDQGEINESINLGLVPK